LLALFTREARFARKAADLGRVAPSQAAALQRKLENMNFLNPLFLLGGLAAAVPILLHLIRREHARKIEFPSLMFLRRISKKTIRYQKLRHLLLLLLRVLAMLLIVLAFTRPYFASKQESAIIKRGATAHIILLDHSLSMGFRDRWDRAKKAAAEIIRKSASNDKFALLEFSDRTNALDITSDPSEMLSSIREAKLSDQPTRYGQALRAAEKIAMDAGTSRQVIHIISDFQRSGWAAEERDFRLSAGIELQHVDVGSDQYSNLAIRDVRVLEGGDEGTLIKASPTNFGSLDRKNAVIRFSIDGRSVAEQRIDLPAGSSRGVEFRAPGLIAGVHPAMLEIDDSELAGDNRFYMTLENRAKTPVLVIEDRGRAARSPSFYLSNALNIDALSPYKITVVSPRNLQLSGNLIIWNNAPAVDMSLQKKLQTFVESGGGLAVVWADSSRSAEFNSSFGSWLPVNAGPVTASRLTDEYALMTDIRMDHPIFHPFNKPHSGNFSSARFFRYAKLVSGSGAEVPARFENGDPALITMKVGKGRALVFASSADDESNDLYLKAVYAPLWQQSLRFLESFREKRRWVEVGDAISPQKLLSEAAMLQSKIYVKSREAIAVLNPDKQRVLVAPGGDAVEIDQAGFYEIRTMSIRSVVAANVQPKESDLAHGNAEEMTAGWKSTQPASISPDMQIAPENQEQRQRLWIPLLIAAAVILMSELLLSNLRFTIDDLRMKPNLSSQS
jgi:uncharacterized membrane protein